MGRRKKNEVATGPGRKRGSYTKQASDDDVYKTNAAYRNTIKTYPQRNTSTRRQAPNQSNDLEYIEPNSPGKDLGANKTTRQKIIYNEVYGTEDAKSSESFHLKNPKLWKQMIRIGDKYQHKVSDTCYPPQYADIYYKDRDDSEEHVVFDGERYNENEVANYMKKATNILNNYFSNKCRYKVENSKFSNETVPDNETLLIHLEKCKGDFELALKTIKSVDFQKNKTLLHMTPEDCDLFDYGFEQYGKNFYFIKNYLMTDKTVDQLVEYYYTLKSSLRFHLLKAGIEGKFYPDSHEKHMMNSVETFELPYVKNYDGSYSLKDMYRTDTLSKY